MTYFLYKIEHDYGLAPNPFHGYCTLAVCKSQIRNSSRLNIGDWVIGIGSKALNNQNRIVFAMQVEEIIFFNDYWQDARFQNKKPKVNGSLVQMYGDNFYHYDESSKKWIQENSAHSKENGKPNKNHLTRDVGGKKVLISQTFYYFGENSIEIPEALFDKMNGEKLRNYKILDSNIGSQFIQIVRNKYEIGIHGDPSSWSIHLKDD